MPETETRWPNGDGEMPERIRAHNWAATPLGPLKGWAQSLRTAVDMVLAMPGPATILWGSTHVQLYNDAYITIARRRHPGLLGCPVAEGWPEAYDAVIVPLLDSVRAGRSIRLVDFAVSLSGLEGPPEARVFDTDWSPIRAEDGLVAGTLQTLVEVTDRHKAQASLRESAARLRLLIESWAQAMWETDATGVVVTDSPSWRAYTGQTREEWLGYGWLNAIHPDDRAYAERQWREAIAVRGLVDAEFRLRAPDGGWRWTNVRAAPVLDARGHIEKWAGMNIDIDARNRAEGALRESEQRLSAFGEASSDVLWMRDAETFPWVYLTPAFETIYGVDRTAALSDDNMLNWVELIVPEDREHAVASIERVKTGERVTFECRIRRPVDGGIRWVRDTDFPMRDAAGVVRWIGGVSRDITEEKETAEHMNVLVAELQHRTRNLMGIVRTTADKTLRSSVDLPDFKARYGMRLEALARVQGLLSHLAEGDRVTFDALIEGEIAALNGEASRISLEGPRGVALRSSSVQTFALALHELATNALKYGALAQPQARLEIRWRVEYAQNDGRPWLHVDWRERGVRMPVQDASPRGRGSGLELIERALPYQLGAKTTYVMAKDGVHCTIALPVSDRVIENGHA